MFFERLTSRFGIAWLTAAFGVPAVLALALLVNSALRHDQTSAPPARVAPAVPTAEPTGEPTVEPTPEESVPAARPPRTVCRWSTTTRRPPAFPPTRARRTPPR
ncbi:hypothetical protein [Micromonospora sp. 4G55]|uniref:hypothetical protein n=1 Tax=Micromonospora sp. 4G55 TaxID=2806102 RepID=UPI001EE3FF9D|nr:hypothetical protein [Micromonospora sp. 4G55]